VRDLEDPVLCAGCLVALQALLAAAAGEVAMDVHPVARRDCSDTLSHGDNLAGHVVPGISGRLAS
jgi:hypothetical protein